MTSSAQPTVLPVKRQRACSHQERFPDTRAVRHARKSDGTEFEADLWVRVATVDGGSTVGLAIIDLKTKAIPWPLFDPNVELAGIVTDHNWAIEHVSNEVKAILGHDSLT